MATNFTPIGIAGTAMAVVAIKNVRTGTDPFPAILGGALFTTGLVVIGGPSPEMATALASLFLISVLLLHSGPTLEVVNSAVKAPRNLVTNTPPPVHANTDSRSV